MTTHNRPAYKTQTQFTAQEGVTYTQLPCLQDSNTSRRSGRERTTHNSPAYKTRTQVTDEEGRRGWHTHNCPAYKNQVQVADQGGRDIHTTVQPARLEHKSPIRKGVTYIQPPCLQNSNASRQSGRGRTTHDRPAYKTQTQVAGHGGGRGDIHTNTLPTGLKHNLPNRKGVT